MDPWIISIIYASINGIQCRLLWQTATTIINLNLPTLLIKDFNCILSPSDKKGGHPFTLKRDINKFKSFVHSEGLIDLGFQGPSFT